MVEIILVWIPVIVAIFLLYKAIKNFKEFIKTKRWSYFGKFILWMALTAIVPALVVFV